MTSICIFIKTHISRIILTMLVLIKCIVSLWDQLRLFKQHYCLIGKNELLILKLSFELAFFPWMKFSMNHCFITHTTQPIQLVVMQFQWISIQKKMEGKFCSVVVRVLNSYFVVQYVFMHAWQQNKNFDKLIVNSYFYVW